LHRYTEARKQAPDKRGRGVTLVEETPKQRAAAAAASQKQQQKSPPPSPRSPPPAAEQRKPPVAERKAPDTRGRGVTLVEDAPEHANSFLVGLYSC
jgi:hypothetical protein